MSKNKSIIFLIIKIIYVSVVFVVSCLVFSHFLNRGTTDITVSMSEATLPVMNIDMDGVGVNYLYGYTEPMECAYMRDTLTVIGEDRKLGFTVNTYGSKPSSMLFEVRSIDGQRLVESTAIRDYRTSGDVISGSITIKDLIESGTEYMLVFVLTQKDQTEVRYYTRLLWEDDVYAREKVDFVREFTSLSFNKEQAKELTKYLESDSSGDNSGYDYTDIHSSFNQVTWGDLNIKCLGDPRINICELTSSTGYFREDYQVQITEESGPAVCNVTEYFRIRYTSDRIYLLNWERRVRQIFDEKEDIYSGDQIELGINDSEIEISECDGGNIFAFSNEGKLVSVNAAEGKTALIYSFYSDDLQDLRSSHTDHDIHVLNVDETGNVLFMVDGYMNRGNHEGRVGIAVYEYNSTTNTIEECAYVDYTGSSSILRQNISSMSYSDRDGKIYFLLNRNIYEIDIDEKSLKTVAEGLADDAYRVSGTGKMIVWQNDGDVYSCTKLRLMNLSTGISEDVNAGYGEYILPLGFMNEDVVYGLAKSRNVSKDSGGSMIFPMYKIVIRSSEGEILKEYEPDGIYIMDCTISDGQMNMRRAQYSEETGRYEEVSADQIKSTAVEQSLENCVKEVTTEKYETLIQISMKESMETDSVIIQTPQEVMYEGNRELTVADDNGTECFYVYGLHGYDGEFMEAGNAVNEAYNISGLVVDGNGNYVWRKTTRVTKNQIMAITEPDGTDEEYSISECIDAMLNFEGVTTNSRVLLEQGKDAQTILEEHLDNAKVLNLTGCNLDTVLYYINMDIPVLVVLNDTDGYLITGFNDSQIVLYDPQTGQLRKENTEDADREFMESGYHFITYMNY